MTIAVLYKYTGDSRELAVREDGAPDWSAARKMIGEDDAVALQYAAMVGDRAGTHVVAITVGGDDAGRPASVRGALVKGPGSARVIADDAVLTWNRTRTADLIAQVIERMGEVTLVVTGPGSIDESARLMPAIVAGFLGWPCFENVTSIEAMAGGWRLTQASGTGRSTIEVRGPVVCAVTSAVTTVSAPGVDVLRAAAAKPVVVERADAYEVAPIAPREIGWERRPQVERRHRIVTGPAAEVELSRALAEEGIR